MFSDKAPYFITVVIAGLAWVTTHVVDRVLATPMVTYEIKVDELESPKPFNLTIRNVTRDKTFRSVRLILTASPGDALSDASIIPVQPAWEGDQSGKTAGRTFEFTIAELQPGAQFLVAAKFNGPGHPSLRMSAQKDTVFFTRPSWSTYLVDNEMGILIFIGVVGALILIWSLWASRRQSGDMT